jgi:hypothetical protein
MYERRELDFLESVVFFTNSKTIVEVGVSTGDSTAYLCSAAQKTGGHVFGFDVWAAHGLIGQFGVFSTKDAVDRKLNSLGFSNYTLNQINTTSDRDEFCRLLTEQCGGKIDFAFIDGCHSYMGVKSDFSVVYPMLTQCGVIAFHDTLVIDGCREFMFDLRTKYNDGTFDIVDFPFGSGERRCGLSLLVKRSYGSLDISIDEICGSASAPGIIETKEKEWFDNEARSAHPADIQEPVVMDKSHIGRVTGRQKYS